VAILKAFGQRRVQPILIRLANSTLFRRVAERLLPLITVEDCRGCPLLDHYAMACVGFKNFVGGLGSLAVKELIWLIIGIIIGMLLIPLLAFGLALLGILAFLALPFAIPAGWLLIALGIVLIILGIVAVLT